MANDQYFDSKEKLDLIQKMITRTDGFHNYANTKSTIILTFLTAMVVALLANIGKSIDYLNTLKHYDLIVIYKIITTLALINIGSAFFFVAKTIIPFVKPSSSFNIYSFIDTCHYKKTEDIYLEAFSQLNKEETIKSLLLLQYNLSKGLIEKYNNHKISIILLFIAGTLLSFNLFILIFA